MRNFAYKDFILSLSMVVANYSRWVAMHVDDTATF